MRVTGDRGTGRLLGVQLFGHQHAEIAKRIDIAATAIFHGMTVDAVSDLDLSYTPPLGSPWDAVQMGAQAWVRAHPAALSPPRIFSRGTAMSGHDDRHGPQPRRTVTQPSAPPPPRSSSSPWRVHQHHHHSPGRRRPRPPPGTGAGGPGTLTGAGSTYVAPFFALAFAKYHQQHPAVTVNYAAVGSSAGIAAISARQVDFGASDVPMNASELAAATRRPGHPGARRPGRRRRGLQPQTSRQAPGCT